MRYKGSWKIVKDFSSWTSAHGIPHIGSALNVLLKAFWTLVTITCLVMFIYVEYKTIESYLSYGVSMQTELKFEEREFPAVTLCHANPYKVESINTLKPGHGKTNLMQSMLDIYTKVKTAADTEVETLKKWGFNQTMDYAQVETLTRKWIVMLGASMEEEQIEQIAYRRDDLIMSCAYNTKACNVRHVSIKGTPSIMETNCLHIPIVYGDGDTLTRKTVLTFWMDPSMEAVQIMDKYPYMETHEGELWRHIHKFRHDVSPKMKTVVSFLDAIRIQKAPLNDHTLTKNPHYGYCYTFNADAKYKSTRAGPLYGLRMLIAADRTRYLPYVPLSGMFVTIHGQNEPAFPEAFGLSAAPGYSTSFGIKYVKTVRMAHPYSNCKDQVPPETDYFYNDKPIFSIEACYRSCIQKNIISKCGCHDPQYQAPPGARSCAQLNATVEEESIRTMRDMIRCLLDNQNFNVIEKCNYCTEPCEESAYIVTVSTALWPSSVYKPTDCTSAEMTARFWKKFENCTQWYRDNTLLIELYYERMNYQLMSETPDHTLVSVISDTGGHLGLWLGSSFITCVELGSLFVILCLFCCKKEPPPPDTITNWVRNKPPKNFAEKPNEKKEPENSDVDEYDVYSHTEGDPTPPPIAE